MRQRIPRLATKILNCYQSPARWSQDGGNVCCVPSLIWSTKIEMAPRSIPLYFTSITYRVRFISSSAIFKCNVFLFNPWILEKVILKEKWKTKWLEKVKQVEFALIAVPREWIWWASWILRPFVDHNLWSTSFFERLQFRMLWRWIVNLYKYNTIHATL